MLRELLGKALSWTNPSGVQSDTSNMIVVTSPSIQRGEKRAIELADTSSLVMTAVNWLSNAMATTPLVVLDADGVEIPNHYIARLLANPKSRYGYRGREMRMGMMTSWCFYGNVYIEVVASSAGIPTRLEWRHNRNVSVRVNNATGELRGYTYRRRAGTTRDIPINRMIHIRRGMDADNPALGVSPLKPLGNAIWIDAVAGAYTAELAENWGIPGLIMTPEPSAPPLSPMRAREIREQIKRDYGPGNRGETLIPTHPMRVQRAAFNPSEMDMTNVRNTSEERVAAAYGLPPAIINLGTGLEKGDTRATHGDMRKQAWSDAVIPVQDLWAEQLTYQLLSSMADVDSGISIQFDRSAVEELQRELQGETTRLLNALKAGGITRADFKRGIGIEATPADDVYLVPMNVIPTPATGPPTPSDAGDAEDPEDEPDASEDSKMRVANRKVSAQRLADLQKRFAADWESLTERHTTLLTDYFVELGERAASEVATRLEELEPVKSTSGMHHATRAEALAKISPQELAVSITSGLSDLAGGASWIEVGGLLYANTLAATVNSINTAIQLGIMLPDPVQERVIAVGGTRLGLIDIREQTQDAIFRALTISREEGEHPRVAAQRIRDYVSAGKWTTAGPRYRAYVIARTETKYAQNVSSLEAYDTSPVVNSVMAVDAQAGGEQDDECVARNGEIYSIREARTIVDHPNGTLSWSPVVEDYDD